MKDISMHIMDIFQNSVRAGASKISLRMIEDTENDTLTLRFNDNGSGMDRATLDKVQDPFFTTRKTRRVGLGLPLLKQNAERTGGHFSIVSALGKGTEVEAVFGLSHIDRPPMGDISGAVVLTATSNKLIRFLFHYKKNDIDYTFDTDEVSGILDGVAIDNPQIMLYLREMLDENIK